MSISSRSGVRTFMLVALLVISGIQQSWAQQVFQQGVEAFRNEAYEEALKHFLTVEQQGNTSVALYYNLGATYYQLQDYQRSSSYFEHIRDDVDWGALAEYNLGLIAEQTEAYQQALNHYQQVELKTVRSDILKLARSRSAAIKNNEPVESETILFSLPVFAYFAAAVGFDDNPAQINDVTGSGSGYVDLTASATVFLQGNTAQGLSLDFDAYRRNASELDADTVLGVGMAFHAPRMDWQTRLGLRGGFFWVEGEQQTLDVSFSAAAYRDFESTRLLISNDLSWINGADDFSYLDGFSNRSSFRWRQGRLWELGYQLALNDRQDLTDDPYFYSYSPLTQRLHGLFRVEVFDQTELTLQYERLWSHYADDNIEAGSNGELIKKRREDTRNRWQLKLDRQLNDTWLIFAEVVHVKNVSNLEIYQYSGNQIGAGLEAVF